jgi:predicted alpha/beta superfamily hydrolase
MLAEFVLAAALGPVVARQAAPDQTAHVGKLDIRQLHSRSLDAVRTIRVWVPPNLSQRTRCNVLYLNDGQNLFGDGDPESGGGGWHVDTTVARLIADGKIDPLIVVGIDNGGDAARAIDYLPAEPIEPASVQSPPAAEPPSGADRYLSFVVDEVMPYVNGHYPTMTGAAHTGIGGSSYGAAGAFYAILSRPGVFGRALLESPSLGVSNGVMLERARTFTAWPERIDIGIGSEEGRGGRGRESSAIDTLSAILRADGFTDDRLRVVVQEGGRHNEASWAARLPEAIAFLFHK